MGQEEGTSMSRYGLITVLAVALAIMTTTAASASQEERNARYRVRHGGRVAFHYFERKGSFETFTSRKADRLEPNIGWIDHREPTDAGHVDIEFAGKHRILLITRTLGGRWFCTITRGSGDRTLGRGSSFESVNTRQACIKSS
jgi:hypothetical protein